MTAADMERIQREMVMRHESHKLIRQFALACALSPEAVAENTIEYTCKVDTLLDKLDELRGATWVK